MAIKKKQDMLLAEEELKMSRAKGSYSASFASRRRKILFRYRICV